MKRFAIQGNIVLPDRILKEGTLVVEGGRITQVHAAGEPVAACQVYDFSGRYVAPGFVDIHCHGSMDRMAYEDPAAVLDYHVRHGTAAIVFSLYRNLRMEETLRAIEAIKRVMEADRRILGVHMEGPYLDPGLGSKTGTSADVRADQYRKILETGVIRQWTFAPELAGSLDFCREIAAAGIVPAVGHSRASAQQVAAAVRAGAKIVTHLMDATGVHIDPSRFGGTKEVDFDAACLLQDGLFYEIIYDKNGIHVRHDMIRLVIKTVGVDRIIGITDCYPGQDDGTDVNFEGAELTGSKLTMDKVAQNFLSLGLSVPEVFKVTAFNPARAMGLEQELGQLKTGCRADILIADECLHILQSVSELAERIIDERRIV